VIYSGHKWSGEDLHPNHWVDNPQH